MFNLHCMKIHKIIYIYVCFSLIIAQQKEEIEKPIFQWEYFTGSGDAIAQKLSLQWLENRRKEYIVKTGC